MLDKSVFDPDIQDRVADNMTPAEFGIQVARVIQESPSSGNWTVAGQTIQAVTGWSPDWDQSERLINRIAQAAIPSPSAADVASGEKQDAAIDDSHLLRNTVLHALRSLLDGPQREALESGDNTSLLSAKDLETLVSACEPDGPVDMQCVVSGGVVRSFGSHHPLAYLLEGVVVIDFDDDDPEPDAYSAPLDGSDRSRACRPVFCPIEPSELYRIEMVDECGAA